MGKQRNKGKGSSNDLSAQDIGSPEPTPAYKGPPAVIALELGLANGRVACVRDGSVEVVANEQGNRATPACVAFTDDETLLGETAVSQLARNPRNTVVDLRRLLGLASVDGGDGARWAKGWRFATAGVTRGGEEQDGDPTDGPPSPTLAEPSDPTGVRVRACVRGAEKAYAPDFVAGLLLKKLRSDAESFLNTPAREAVMPVPVGTTDAQASALKRAALAAGLRATLVPSPIAAALGVKGLVEAAGAAHAAAEANDETATAADAPPAPPPAAGARHVLVLEWGASHASAALLAVDGGRVAIREAAADEALSTRTADALLLQYLVGDVQRKTRVKLDDGEHARGLLKLAEAAESARCVLSKGMSAQMTLEALADERDYQVALSRPKLDELLSPLIAKVVDLAVATVAGARHAAAAGAQPPRISALVLAGGGCATPRLQALARAAFPDASFHCDVQPDETAVVGCARLAALFEAAPRAGGAHGGAQGGAHAADAHRPRQLRAPLAPRTLSVEAAGGARVVLLSEGTPLPATRKIRLDAPPAAGASMRVAIFEEAADGDGEEPRLLGAARTRAAPTPFELILTLARDGTLTLSQKAYHGSGGAIEGAADAPAELLLSLVPAAR